MVNAVTPPLFLLNQAVAAAAGARHCVVYRLRCLFPRNNVGPLRKGIQRITLRLYLYWQALSAYGEPIPKRGSLSTITETASVKPPPRNVVTSAEDGVTAAVGGSSSSSSAVGKTSVPKRAPLHKLNRGGKPPPDRSVVELANWPGLPGRYWNASQNTPGAVLASTIPSLGPFGPYAPKMTVPWDDRITAASGSTVAPSNPMVKQPADSSVLATVGGHNPFMHTAKPQALVLVVPSVNKPGTVSSGTMHSPGR